MFLVAFLDNFIYNLNTLNIRVHVIGNIKSLKQSYSGSDNGHTTRVPSGRPEFNT